MGYSSCNAIIDKTGPGRCCCKLPHVHLLCRTTCLAAEWNKICTPILLFPSIDLLSGDQEIPVPFTITMRAWSERAVQFILLLAALGVSAAIGTGAAGLTASFTSYRSLSEQFTRDVQQITDMVLTLQTQMDSLVAVVLQNRWGLDLLTAEKGGLCLFLQEECCFYVNQSGIVRDKVRNLQEELQKWREQLGQNSWWPFQSDFWQLLLPFLSPLLIIGILFNCGTMCD